MRPSSLIPLLVLLVGGWGLVGCNQEPPIARQAPPPSGAKDGETPAPEPQRHHDGNVPVPVATTPTITGDQNSPGAPLPVAPTLPVPAPAVQDPSTPKPVPLVPAPPPSTAIPIGPQSPDERDRVPQPNSPPAVLPTSPGNA